MTIQELRERAGRAISQAEKVRDDSRPWSEKQAEFDQHVKDATDAQKEIQTLETREQQFKQLSDLRGQFLEPQNQVSQPSVQSQENFARQVNEAFRHYVRGERRFGQEVLATCRKIHKEAFYEYLRNDVNGLSMYASQNGQVGMRELHALVSTDQTLGGFLVYDEIRNEIIKAEAGYAVLAPICRVEPTNSTALVFPKMVPHSSDVRRTSGFTGKFQREGYVTGGTAPTVQNQPTWAQERIPVHSWQPDAIEIGKELLEDTGANLESIIANAIGECLAFDKDDKILNGNVQNANEPQGILQAGISTVASGGATSIAYGGLVAMFTEVPAQYRQRATWVMASRTMGAILQLNTGTGGVYLFPPNQWNNEILTRPVRFLDYGMDTATTAGGTTFTAGEYPVIFGDFSRYVIAQRQALMIQRLVERFAPNIGILPTARLGGQVVLTDAFRVMRVAAT